ncbi:MAG: cation-translocating P-type ATPase [Eubacteriales bacterium]|nr:cation-translocating P-type ATPase [Eubacteriales bacterium]
MFDTGKSLEIGGLHPAEVKKRQQKYGLNVLTAKKKKSVLGLLFKQFRDFMTMILLAATAVSAFMGEITEAVTIVAIIVMNGILGFIQEYRTEKTLEALKRMAAPSCRVIRGGRVCSIAAEELVPGDLVLLEEGDRVPADAVLIEANGLTVDESLLTGESIPVEKKVVKTETRKNANELEKIYMGTVVTRGRGRGVVYSTGMLTEMGKIADMIQTAEESQTPLQKRLEQLGKIIIAGCLIICAIVAIAGILRGEDVLEMLLAGISLAVAAVPEGLPAVVTISLALGVQRMLKRNALIRVLPAVETLGCADIICSDKTGTLTENMMTVREIYSDGGTISVEASKNDKNGNNDQYSFFRRGSAVTPKEYAPLKLALEVSSLCNNSRLSVQEENTSNLAGKIKYIFRKKESIKAEGDPTEVALMMAALKGGLEKDLIQGFYKRNDEIPFDSDRKCMSVMCFDRQKKYYVFTKGAPDIVLEKCTKLYTSSGLEPLTAEKKRRISEFTDSMASKALRVLGLAYKASGSRYRKEDMEKELVFVGLIGMIDPPRPEAYSAVQKCMLSGIKPVMITGDHKITACAIARELQIFNRGDKVLTGSEMDSMSDRDLDRVADKVSVYARVTPAHKLKIVRILKKKGHIVAMTGDGVNDAPAIKEADIGVAMGEKGTDVTREASSMILMDDNFATIVAAIEEGRVIYENIRRFIRYLLSCNIGEVLTMFLGIILGMPVPLLPIQILWINLVTDGLPAIALGLEPAEKDIMKRPPRRLNSGVFSEGLGFLILVRGIFIGLCTLAVYATVLYFTQNIELGRTAAFVTLILTQLIHVYECKSEKKTIFHIKLFNNIYLVLATSISALMTLAAIYLPFSNRIFKTVPLTLKEWTIILGFSLLGPALSGIFRKIAWRRK